MMLEIRVASESEHGVCDFCSDPKPARYFDAESGIIAKDIAPRYGSVGAWAACESCAKMIDEERWHDLVDHALAAMRKKHGIPRHQLLDTRQTIQRALNFFRNNRKAVPSA